MPKKSAKTTAKQPAFGRVPTRDILFDQSNPRFGGENAALNQAEIQQVLMNEPHLASLLIESLIQNGFIPYEPLVVRRKGNKYIVIEGNRRLAAVRHILANPHEYPPHRVTELLDIPVLIFHESADASHLRDIRTYLGVRHLVGFRDWPAESKAHFLDQNIKSKADLKRVIKEFAIKKQDISRYLIPFRIKRAAEDLLEEFEISEDQTFWMLGEALSRTGIKQYIALHIDPDSLKVKSFDKEKFRYLLEFLYGATQEARPGSRRVVSSKRITETRQLTRLGRVLANKAASKKLEEGSTLEEAEVYIEKREDAVDELTDAIKIALQKIIALKPTGSESQRIAQLFVNFQQAIRAYSKNAKSNI